VGLGSSLGFTGLLVYNIVNVFRNKTTLEAMFRKSPNPYDVGRFNNFRQIFGTSPLVWFLPYNTAAVDPTNFPRNDEDNLESEV
jgi:hypothetical protein